MPQKKTPGAAKTPQRKKPYKTRTGVANKTNYHEWETEDKILLLQGWARDGLTNEQIAHNVGVRPETITRWKKQSPQICKALKESREVLNRQLENALIKRALGFEYVEKMTEISDTGTKHRETVKRYPPDVGALVFALVNRFGDHYKQKRPDDTDSEAALKKLDDVLGKLDDSIEDAPDDEQGVVSVPVKSDDAENGGDDE